ncbi:MAG TPA: hypothetical protein DD723_01500 [Candidatus Omnitrophica bacterium]|nr:hypothetical protein [Candidatus Omnitrophota bacterium]
MRLHYGVYISLAAVLSGALAGSGCDRRPAKRTYHEIVQSAPAQPARPMIPAFGEARQGRPVSGELDMSSIPNDDVHAFLRNGQGTAAIPDDDIHASLSKGQGEASGAMPAFGEARPPEARSAKGDQGRPMMAVRLPMGGAVDQQTQKMLEASVARPPLSWATPEGWRELPGSGMRLATFRSADTGDPVECALISLAGDAGGLESNAARWMQQVNIAVPDAPAMEKFLAAQKKIKTTDGFDATILDLAQLQSQDDLESPSMAATIITLPEMTVFVKMTGTRGAVLKNRDQFETLCESLKLN